LVYLCTHKVAYLTVLKVINQRNEPEARDSILEALFFSPEDQVLEDILADQASGATLIFKVLTTPFFDEKIRADVVANIHKVLLKIRAQPSQGYKRLMDEVGLSARNAGTSNRDTLTTDRSIPDSPVRPYSGSAPFIQPQPPQQQQQQQPSFDNRPINGSLFPPGQGFQGPDSNQQRNASIISIATDSTLNPYSPIDRSGSFSFGSSPLGHMPYQQPQQQSYLGSGRTPNQFGYGGGGGGAPNMMNLYGGQQQQQHQDFRNTQQRGGMGHQHQQHQHQQQQNGMQQAFAPQYGQQMMGMGMGMGWQPGYPGPYMMQGQPPMSMSPQMMNGGVRRGRVSLFFSLEFAGK